MQDFAIGVILLIVILVIFCGGIVAGENLMKKHAVQNHVAHYVINETNGETYFEWIKP